MGAIPQEVDLIRSDMNITEEVTLGGRTFYVGELHGCDVVLVFSRIGKVAASSVTTTLINLFKIDFLLFTGVAGAVHPDLNIGDIVIGEVLYQHDMDGRPLFPKFHIPLTEKDSFLSHENDLSCAERCIVDFFQEIEKHIDQKALAEFSIVAPKGIRGTIATGDQFISNPLDHEDMIFKEEGAHAVEMEGAAVAQICHEYNIPFLIIRTISDNANHSAAIDFQKFITSISNRFSRGIVQKLLPELMNIVR
jgi:adenosylhomocysteine nucleosidase